MPGKPFKLGQSGNPSGRPKLPPEIRTARKKNMSKLIGLVTKHFGLKKAEAKALSQKPEVTKLEEAVMYLVDRACKGDVNAFRYLMELMIGKIPETDFDEYTEDELMLLGQIKEAMSETKESDRADH